MKIEVLYCVIQYGENWESAFRRLRNEAWQKWWSKQGIVIADGREVLGFTTSGESDSLDSLRYVLGGKK